MKTVITILTALILSNQAVAAQPTAVQLTASNYKDYADVRTPVTFLGFARVKAGKEEEFATIVDTFVGTMRAQRGNISYDYHQNLADPTEFFFVEEWKNGSDLEAHMDSKAVGELVSKVGPLFASSLQILVLKKN